MLKTIVPKGHYWNHSNEIKFGSSKRINSTELAKVAISNVPTTVEAKKTETIRFIWAKYTGSYDDRYLSKRVVRKIS